MYKDVSDINLCMWPFKTSNGIKTYDISKYFFHHCLVLKQFNLHMKQKKCHALKMKYGIFNNIALSSGILKIRVIH